MKEYKRGQVTVNPQEVRVIREAAAVPSRTSPGTAGAPAHDRNAACLGPLDPLTDVSVVIVNWNTKNLLHACLTSLQDHATSVRVETIVVDNASRDGSAQMVAHDFPEVRLLVNARNMGFAAANNRGMTRARGRYVLLLNSDTVVLPGAVQEMVRYMDAHPHVGAAGPRLLNSDCSPQSSMRNFPHLGRDALAILEMERWPLISPIVRRHSRHTTLDGSDHSATREVDWVVGACLLLRREAIEDVGPLDEGYFFFAEEMDLCWRLRHQGWPIVFLAGAEIVHLGGQSAARVPAARLTWHYAGLLRFYGRHRTPAHRVALRAVIALAAAMHLMWLLVRYGPSPRTRPLLAAYAKVLARALT
jgi:N-acetylglucosaminyl-diphospho-decaprenol L-rhamnosyltransferase